MHLVPEALRGEEQFLDKLINGLGDIGRSEVGFPQTPLGFDVGGVGSKAGA